MYGSNFGPLDLTFDQLIYCCEAVFFLTYFIFVLSHHHCDEVFLLNALDVGLSYYIAKLCPG